MAAADTDNHHSVVLRASYDQAVDVLHLAVREPSDIEGEGLPRGVELDYSADDGMPSGVTVIGFNRNGWIDDIKVLAVTISRHLNMEPSDIVKVIQESLRPGGD